MSDGNEKIRMSETVNAIKYTEVTDTAGNKKVVRKDVSEHKEVS